MNWEQDLQRRKNETAFKLMFTSCATPRFLLLLAEATRHSCMHRGVCHHCSRKWNLTGNAIMYVTEEGLVSQQSRLYSTALRQQPLKEPQRSFKLYLPIKHLLGTEIQIESTNWKLKKTKHCLEACSFLDCHEKQTNPCNTQTTCCKKTVFRHFNRWRGTVWTLLQIHVKWVTHHLAC